MIKKANVNNCIMEDMFPVEVPDKWLIKARKLNVKAEDITEQFVRGSGKGGQKINKTSSMVFLKHEPTGIAVKCQKHRELSKNRVSAFKILIDKIEEKELGAQSERAKKIFKLRKQKAKRTKRSKEKMLQVKKARGLLKENRRLLK
jgi:peptide chain release factor